MKKTAFTLLLVFVGITIHAQWTDNGSTLTTTDNVGIGETNPQIRLHVKTANTNSEILRLDGGTRTTSLIDYPGGIYDNAGLQFKKNSTIGRFKFSNNNGDLLTILASGKLHISNSDVNSELLVLDGGPRPTSLINYTDGTYDNVGLQFKKNSTIGQFKFSNNNGDLLKILANGKLHISNTSVNSEVLVLDGGPRPTSLINYSDGTYDNVGLQFKKNSTIGQFKFSNNNGDLLTIRSNGSVGIGTNSTFGYKLAVNGTIGSKEVNVENTSAWPDFVFDSDYDLRSLEEVEKHIAEKGHLPEIPSEVEVAENGINLGEMDAKLLQKIEELTLYLIEQNKQNQAQQTRIEQLEQKIAQLENKQE